MDVGNQQPQTSSGLRLGVTIVLVVVSAIVFGLIGWWAGKQQATTETSSCSTLPSVLPPVPSVPEEESSATETPTTSATSSATATATSTT